MATPESNITRETILGRLRAVTAKLNIEDLTVVEANRLQYELERLADAISRSVSPTAAECLSAETSLAQIEAVSRQLKAWVRDRQDHDRCFPARLIPPTEVGSGREACTPNWPGRSGLAPTKHTNGSGTDE